MQSCSRPTYSALLPSATCPPRKVVHPHQTHGPSPSESIMSKSFCKTQLLGFTGADPILSTLSNGTATASINIATSVNLFDPTLSRFVSAQSGIACLPLVCQLRISAKTLPRDAAFISRGHRTPRPGRTATPAGPITATGWLHLASSFSRHREGLLREPQRSRLHYSPQYRRSPTHRQTWTPSGISLSRVSCLLAAWFLIQPHPAPPTPQPIAKREVEA